jgi:hypothetical protein
MHCALEGLIACGWAQILEHICGRIKGALRTNLPPADEPAARALSELLAALRAKH